MTKPDINSAHLYLRERWPKLAGIFKADTGNSLELLFVHRTPEEQLGLFKKGREILSIDSIGYVTSRVTDSKSVVTDCDGFGKRSQHNYFPSRAIDVCVKEPNGRIKIGK